MIANTAPPALGKRNEARDEASVRPHHTVHDRVPLAAFLSSAASFSVVSNPWALLVVAAVPGDPP